MSQNKTSLHCIFGLDVDKANTYSIEQEDTFLSIKALQLSLLGKAKLISEMKLNFENIIIFEILNSEKIKSTFHNMKLPDDKQLLFICYFDIHKFEIVSYLFDYHIFGFEKMNLLMINDVIENRKSISESPYVKFILQGKKNPLDLVGLDLKKHISYHTYAKSVIENGEYILVYDYTNISFTPSENAFEILKQMILESSWNIDYYIDGDHIYLKKFDKILGEILEKKEMIHDWIEKKDPFYIWFEDMGDSKNHLHISFYRNEQKKLQDRESTIIKLLSYSGDERQLYISMTSEGEKLEFLEDTFSEDVWISDLGKLPKKYAKKYNENGAAAVFLDHLEMDDHDNEVPYVIIYW